MNTIQKILLVATMFATALQAQVKVSELDALTTPATGDLFIAVDVSDTTMATSGTTKKISLGTIETFLFGNLESATLTLENKTISGADNTLSDVPWSSLLSVPSPVSALAAGTWSGANSITTLGTITTGTWNGTAIGDSYISSAANWNAKIGGSTGSTDNAILRADGTGGNTAQASLATITDAGELSIRNRLDVSRAGREYYAFRASVIEDPYNDEVDALVIAPVNQNTLRLFFGYDDKQFYEIIFSGVYRIVDVPGFTVRGVGGSHNYPTSIGQISAFPGLFEFNDRGALVIHDNLLDRKIEFHAGETGLPPDASSVRADIVNGVGFTVYGDHTSDTSLEGIRLGHDGSTAYIDVIKGSTGGTVEPLEIRMDGEAILTISTEGKIILNLDTLPTDDTGEDPGTLWLDGDTLKVSH